MDAVITASPQTNEDAGPVVGVGVGVDIGVGGSVASLSVASGGSMGLQHPAPRGRERHSVMCSRQSRASASNCLFIGHLASQIICYSACWTSLALFLLLIATRQGVLASGDGQGPLFVVEPPARVEFSNSTGSRLDCTARGVPTPSIQWTLGDGSPAGRVTGLRHHLSNGSLAFPAFNAAEFRPDVHRATYKCVAVNDLGRVVSRDVRLRAVVMQEFSVSATSDTVTRGNSALLKCQVPSFVRDYISVTSWLQNHSYNIYPTSNGDGKLHMLPTGELFVANTGTSDSYSSYQCRVTHRLSGETRVSFTSARVTVTEPRSESPPKFTERSSSLEVRRDDLVVLPCLAQGHPPPEYQWEFGGASFIGDDQRYTVGGLLIIPRARSTDTGRYMCVAFNAAGRAVLETSLLVSSPLSTRISPAVLTAALAQPAELACVVSGQPVVNIAWAKNGQPISGMRGNQPGEVLRLQSVTREDLGMYQCFAKNENDMAQASAELRLGDTPPQLVYRFIHQTIQPGPTISLKCVASGNPTPNMKWTLDGFPLPQLERFVIGQYVPTHGDVISHVNITHVHVEDGGLYECTASNRIGETSHSAQLNVYGPPQIRPMGDISAVAGETLRVTCPVAGYPIDLVKWYRGDRLLPLNRRQIIFPNGSLVIEKVQSVEDGGSYRCVATNKQGKTASGTAQINVMVPPKITPFSFRADLHLGERVGVQCVVSKGDPPLTMHWLKDGHELSTSSQTGVVERNLDEFTSVLSIGALARSHGGNFTCVAQNAAARDAHSATLSVNVPPAITPFSFGELSSGERARVTCSVKRGDPPLSITWLRDDRPLPSPSPFTQHDSAEVTVQHVDEYSSVLAIPSVSSRHSGNYTCVARNPARSSRHTAQLLVTVPPAWLVEPQNGAAKLGHQAVLDCKVEGFPQPSVAWKKAAGLKPGQYQELSARSGQGSSTIPGLELLSNGSLRIEAVSQDDEGSYLCEASNGIGVGLSAVVQLTVHAPVHFKVRSRKELVRRGASAMLKCQALGDLPINLTWRKEGSFIELQGRASIKNTTVPGGLVSELTVRSVRSEDGGVYTCFARNEFGHDQTAMHLLVQDAPASPTNLHVLQRSSRRLSIAWTPAQDGNSPITRYLVRYSPTQVMASWQSASGLELSVEGSQSSAALEGLQPATSYAVAVLAENAVGSSPVGRELTAHTDEEAPSAPPHHVSVDATSSTQLTLSFLPPPTDQWNGPLLGHYVGHRELGEPDGKRQYNFTTVPWREVAKEDTRLDGLKKFCKYGLVVQAFNNRGPGPLTPEIVAQTLEDVPEASPRDVRCSAVSPESLQVSWQPPPEALVHGVIQGYKLIFEPIPSTLQYGAEVEAQSKMTTALTTVLHGLLKFTNYSIELLAFTRVGDGVKSAKVFCTTKEDVPGPPESIKAVLRSVDTALVTWLPPSSPNGQVLKYGVYVRLIEGVEGGRQMDMRSIPHLSTSQLHYELPGLKKRLRYEFWVTAFTKVGEGQSTPVAALTPSTKVSAAIVSFGGTRVAAWKSDVRLPCRAVGIPTPSRQWSMGVQPLGGPMGAPGQSRSIVAPDGTLVLSGVQRADQGEYTCVVTNAHGTDAISFTLAVQVPPGAPLLLMTGNTPHSLQLQWKLGDDGGSSVRGFVIHYKLEHGEWEEAPVEGGKSTHTLSGLRCGTAYHVFVTAHNRVGSGPPSGTLAVRTRGALPLVPPPTDLLVVNTSAVGLKLASWPDGGCPLLYFVVEYASYGSEDWSVVGNNIGAEQLFELVGLSAATSYKLRVSAHNGAGSSVGSYRFTTLDSQGATLGPSHVSSGHEPAGPVVNMKMVILGAGSLTALALSLLAICFCIKRRTGGGNSSHPNLPDIQPSATSENKHNSARREQFYATVRKLPPSPAALECIPEYSEDIRPYATFHVSGGPQASEATKLQTFVYREHDMSPTRKSIKSEYCRVKKCRPGSEIDSEGSESDTEPGTSSRTESSNQLDDGGMQGDVLRYHPSSSRLKLAHLDRDISYPSARGDWSPPPEASPGIDRRPFQRRYCQAHLLK